jgi:hypothetical protein
MTSKSRDVTDAAAAAPTRQALAIEGRSRRLKVSGKLARAIDYMLEGARRPEAAQRAGLSDHGLRAALRKPHVRQHYREQLEVMRESERPRNILRAAEIRDQDRNLTASVAAIKVLEGMDEERVTPAGMRATTPGVVIVINAQREVHQIDNTLIEINPTDAAPVEDDE